MSECGVIVAGGSVPSRNIIDSLAFNTDNIFCADSGFDNAIALGMQPSVVIGDMDSVQGNIPLDVLKVVYNTDKANTDTELAISFATEHGYKPLILVGGGYSEGRIDHFLALYHLFHRSECQIHTWITDIACITYHTIGVHHLNCAIGETISIFGSGYNQCHATSTGLYWPLDSIQWDVTTTTGVSNRATATNIILTIESGAMIVVRTITAMTAHLTTRQSS